ncbi:hypothetical protein OH77DRAFT_380857 [Trametes cingulata]|nr:hypothetical protein OH77DRAFT_380857 [Trametes cingulata]
MLFTGWDVCTYTIIDTTRTTNRAWSLVVCCCWLRLYRVRPARPPFHHYHPCVFIVFTTTRRTTATRETPRAQPRPSHAASAPHRPSSTATRPSEPSTNHHQHDPATTNRTRRGALSLPARPRRILAASVGGRAPKRWRREETKRSSNRDDEANTRRRERREEMRD